MIVRKLSDAKAYEAPNHRDYKSLRVFGAEMGGSQTLIFGISHFLPGGGAGPDASPPEKDLLRAGGRVDGDRRRQGDRRESRATPATSARTKAARSSTAATKSAPSRLRSAPVK